MADERIQAEFNSALEYLKRINAGFALAAEASINLNGYAWSSALAWLFRELSTQMKPEELKIYEAESYFLLSETSGRQRLHGNLSKQLYERLTRFELHLRKVFKDSGLEMKYAEDAKHILFKGGA